MDSLGERISTGRPSESDLALLASLQNEHVPALEIAVGILRSHLRINGSARFEEAPVQLTSRLKTVGVIIDKLRRGISLSVMQDIVGARIVGGMTLSQQDRLVERLVAGFASVRIKDRRREPTHGYRAVHVIPTIDGFPVEIQIRTTMQDEWAQTMERLADEWGRGIRYGEPPDGSTATIRGERAAVVEQWKFVSDAYAAFESTWDRFKPVGEAFLGARSRYEGADHLRTLAPIAVEVRSAIDEVSAALKRYRELKARVDSNA